MAELTIHDFQRQYTDIVHRVLNDGERIAPRGQRTWELLNVGINVLHPELVTLNGIGRKWSSKLAALEALQLIGGVSHPELMRLHAPNTVQFMDGGTFHGAYGPRIRQQLLEAEDRLRKDRDTRQAVVTIWDPAYDCYSDPRDLPCTLSVQFLRRRQGLFMTTTMRSNDAWWGLAYDVFQFCQLQLAMANALGVKAATYRHNAASLHVYERDLEAINLLHPPEAMPVRLGGIGEFVAGVGFASIANAAREILRDGTVAPPDTTIAWLRGQLRG